LNQLAAWISHAAAVASQVPALVFAEETLTYSNLLIRSRQIAGSHGADDRVMAVAGESPLELVLAAYAASFACRPFLPLNPSLAPSRHEALLARIGAGVPGAIELLIATSGSSGDPKCVMLSGANLAASVAASRHVLPLREGDVWLACLPLYHIGGMAILHRCAAARAAVLLHEGFDAERVWLDIATRGVTHISLVPAMLARLLDITHGAPPPDTLKYVLVGGGALSAQLAARARDAGWPLCVTYGMSETGSQLATLYPVSDNWEPGCVGKPLPGFEVRIAGHDSAGVGTVEVRGPAVMAGYANPEMRLGMGLADGWFASGDRGRIGEDGALTVLGRRDDMLVSGGVNISPAAIENRLLDFPGLRDAAVTGVPDEIWGERLVALVVGDVNLTQLDGWCRANLANAERPRVLERVAALPRSELGKLERPKLRKMAQELVNDGL
jgi:O-succinylbenzoic acid--CoA ligase